MFKNIKILVFTATYNEKLNIKSLVEQIRKSSPKSTIFIVDDNSPDGTSKIIKKLQKKHKKIILNVRKKKFGLDSAHKIGYEYAKQNKFDFLITMDADLSHNPKDLPRFIKYLKTYPFVLGSRYIPGGKCLMHGKRLLISKIGNFLIKTFSGIKSNEYTTSYRGFNIKKLKNFHLNQVQTNGYSFFMGTIFRLHNLNIFIKEIPITFRDRKKGVSKIPKFEILRTLKNLILFLLNKIKMVP